MPKVKRHWAKSGGLTVVVADDRVIVRRVDGVDLVDALLGLSGPVGIGKRDPRGLDVGRGEFTGTVVPLDALPQVVRDVHRVVIMKHNEAVFDRRDLLGEHGDVLHMLVGDEQAFDRERLDVAHEVRSIDVEGIGLVAQRDDEVAALYGVTGSSRAGAALCALTAATDERRRRSRCATKAQSTEELPSGRFDLHHDYPPAFQTRESSFFIRDSFEGTTNGSVHLAISPIVMYA